MIIKSMSRSSASFASLYDYLTREKESRLNTHNLYASAHDREAVVKEFMQNADYLKRARGKNYLYHEIISLSKSHLSLKEQEKILSDLARQYLSRRAPEHLAFTALHRDKEHVHIHLMISANELMGERRKRLSKTAFNAIQKELEHYANMTYPELEQTNHYQEGKQQGKSRRSEQELKRRTRKPSKKDELYSRLSDIFERSTKRSAFEKNLASQGIEFYTRGKTSGVIYEGKKYRLKTLKLDLEYNQLQNRFDRIKQREAKRAEHKESTKLKSRREQMERARGQQSKARESSLEKER